MNVTCTNRIAVDNWYNFHDILCSTNGRYLATPVYYKDHVQVYYGFEYVEDLNRFEEAFARSIKPIVEVPQKKGFAKWLQRTLRSFW